MYGWNAVFAHGLADECDRLGSLVEAGTYPKGPVATGLGSWIQEEVDPKTTDALKEAVYRAQSYLEAMSRRAKLRDVPVRRDGGTLRP
jgi:hypothetical protein